MKTSNIILSAVHLFLTLITASVGVCFIILPNAPKLIFYMSEIIANRSDLLVKFGIFLLGMAFLLGLGFYALYKTRYLKINMKPHSLDIDTKIIATYIEKYFKSKYPELQVDLEVDILSNDNLEVIAKISSEIEDKKMFLLDMESKIGKMLSSHLNYQKNFVFTLKNK